MLGWIDPLYGGAIAHSGTAKVAGQLALFAAVVLVLALSREFAASGEAITNGHRPRFPRDARVLAFLGYVVVTATVSVLTGAGDLRDQPEGGHGRSAIVASVEHAGRREGSLMAEPVTVLRVYEDPGRAAGEYRVLVDRLWPRGLTSAAVDHDEWAKEVAPSSELRRWYGHRPERFDEFARLYRGELDAPPARDEVGRLAGLAGQHRLVLLTATRDVPRSGAAVLRSVLGAQISSIH